MTVFSPLFLLSIVFSLSTDICPSELTWVSNPSTYVFSDRFRPSVVVPAHNGWKSIDGADWLWESTSNTLGTCTFVKFFPLADRIQSIVQKVSVWIACDDYYGVRLNDQTVVSKDGNWNSPPKEVDLTSYVRYSSDTQSTINKLELLCTNTGGPGGLTFKVVVTFNAGTGRRVEATNSTVHD